MKKQNARRILAFVLALMLALPVLSIPTFAQQTTVQISQDKQNASASSRPESLFWQDFDTLDLGAQASAIKRIVEGPATAQIVAGTDGHGNVLQISCEAVETSGKFYVNLNKNNNIWLDLQILKQEDFPIDPHCVCPQKCTEGAMYQDCPICSAEEATLKDCKGRLPSPDDCICETRCVEGTVNADCPACSAEDANLNMCMKEILPEVPTYKVVWEGTFKTKANETYKVEGEVNTEDFTLVATKVWQERYKTDENGDNILDENGKPIPETVVYLPELTEELAAEGYKSFADINYEGYKLQEKKNPDGTTAMTEKLQEKKDENGNVILDENGKPVMEVVTEIVYKPDGTPEQVPKVIPLLDNFVLDAAGNPVWKVDEETGKLVPELSKETGTQVVKIVEYQATDEEGNLLYNEDGTPQMLTKEEPQFTTEKTYLVVNHPTLGQIVYNGVMINPQTGLPFPKLFTDVMVDKTQPVMIPIMEEVLKTPIDKGVYVVSSQLRDARGGLNNVAKPASMKTANINSEVLVFTADYYFSADDPTTPDVDEGLMNPGGIDIRISALDENGASKNFDFLKLKKPVDGMIEITAHTDAPTEIVAGSKKVPLGSWVNILVVADFTTGIYIIYIDGEMIASRQNVQIKEQEVEEEVLDENGNVVMIEKLDADGNVVMQEVFQPKVEKDADGNVVMVPKLDENGEEVKDENGETVMIPKVVTQIVYTEKLDENGKVVMIPATDPDTGLPVWENGEQVYVPEMTPLKDENGNVVTEVVMEQVFTDTPVLDEEGKPVLNEDGTPKMEPLMEPVMVAKTQKVKRMVPVTNKWVGACTGLKGNSWNLGHFARNGAVSQYSGYMQIDNAAIYDGEQLPALFDYLGYSIDYNEDFENLGIDYKVPMSKENATASVQWDEDGEAGGNKAVKIVYKDNVDSNYTPPTSGASYANTSTVVLEANYFLPNGTASRFQSQLRKVGAIINPEGDPFANYPLASEKKDKPDDAKDKKTKTYDWIDMYWVETVLGDDGNTTAMLYFTGSKNVIDPISKENPTRIEIPVDEWVALSTVIDLKTGAFTLYVNGVERITGNLTKSYGFHEQDGTFTTKNYEFKNISFAPSMWIASKVNKDQKDIGCFYVDDVVMTRMGDLAKMERVEGMLSADIYANGNYVKTVTDNNVFFTSQKITVENRNIFDLKEYAGTEQLLKADDAEIRFTSPAGIRFASYVDREALDALYAMIATSAPEGGEATPTDADGMKLLDVSFGTLIVPTDTLKGNPVTFEALDAAGIKYLDVQGTKDQYYDVDGDETTTHIVGSIVNLKEKNIGRLFSAVTYVRVVLPNGIVYNIYANRGFKTSAQSLADDAWGTYTPAQQAVIDAYFACVKPACDKKEEADTQ